MVIGQAPKPPAHSSDRPLLAESAQTATLQIDPLPTLWPTGFGKTVTPLTGGRDARRPKLALFSAHSVARKSCALSDYHNGGGDERDTPR